MERGLRAVYKLSCEVNILQGLRRVLDEDFPREQSWQAEVSDCDILSVHVFGKLVMHRPNLTGCGGRNPR